MNFSFWIDLMVNAILSALSIVLLNIVLILVMVKKLDIFYSSYHEK